MCAVFFVSLSSSFVFPGIPQSVQNLTEGTPVETDPLQMFTVLNKFGGEHGVGRIDIVENRFIGLKVSV
jgi:argininosuccinate synthase